MTSPQIAREQHGLFSRTQALEDGWTRGRLDRALARGAVVSLAPGILTLAADLEGISRRDRHLLEARALVLAHGDDRHLARRSAAVLHGLPLLGLAPAQVQLTRDARGNKAKSRSRHLRVTELHGTERTRLDELPVTSLARTVYDLARGESLRSAVVVADAALRTGMHRDELLEVLRRHPRWPGSRRAREAILFADGRSESPLESLGRLVCHEEHLPVFEPQVELWHHDELVARLDGLWRDRLVVFEGDGGMKFTGEGVLPALLRRQERIREAGLPVVRASWEDVTRRRKAWAAGVGAELADNPGRLRGGYSLVSTSVRPALLERGDHYRWPPLPSPTPRRRAGRDRVATGCPSGECEERVA
jgi:hypothetical protein